MRYPRPRSVLLAAAATLALPASAWATPAGSANCTTLSQLANGSFEFPAVPLSYGVTGEGSRVAGYPALNHATPTAGAGWNVLPNSGNVANRMLEFWRPVTFAADDGSQFAELEANERGLLYQDLPTVPGATMRWRLAHRARAGAGDVMNVRIGPPGGTMVKQSGTRAATATTTTEMTDGTGAWGRWTGTYAVPAGQTTTRFEFASVMSAYEGGGNWLDSVVFSRPATACDDTLDVREGEQTDIDARANDQGDTLTLDGVTQPEHGTVSIVAGKLRYSPAAGYRGPDGFTYTARDAYGATDTATVTLQVLAVPVAPARTSTGVGTAEQSVAVAVNAGETIALVVGGTEVATHDVPSVGTFSTTPDGLRFVPVLGYSGSPAPVAYRVTNPSTGTADGTFAPTVTKPAVPAADDLGSRGDEGAEQSVRITVPEGGTAELLDATDGRLEVAGEGTYTLDVAARTIRFAPAANFAGTPRAARYRVTDAYGQSSTGSFQPVVVAAAKQSAPAPAPSAPLACVSRRRVTINWVVSKGLRLRALQVQVAGRPVRKLDPRTRRVVVDLSGRPATRIEVTVRGITTKGRGVSSRRVYTTCSEFRLPSRVPTVYLRAARA